jgi:hyperosmotically inducible protein
MKIKLASTLIAGALLLPAWLPAHADDSDADRHDAKAFVKDSAITTKVKAELAKEKMASLVNIHVDTDNKGVVTLSGTAPDQAAIDKAVSIARGVKGVVTVENDVTVASK